MTNDVCIRKFLRRCAGLALVISGLGFALISSPARADLMFSESFAYPLGRLDGKGPPPGSPPGQGTWRTLARDGQVGAPGLVYRGIQSSGNTASLRDDGTSFDGDIVSADITPLGGPAGGVVWIGYLLETFRDQGFATLTFNDATGATPLSPQFGVIYNRLQYGIDNNVIPAVVALTDIHTLPRTVWLVIKLDFNTGQQFLFVNPSRRTEPPEAAADAQLAMNPEFQASGFDSITLREGRSSGKASFDEIRVGTTFANVTH